MSAILELLSPLNAIFSQEPAGVRQRQIFVLPGGEVRNAPDILAAARRHARTDCISTLGINAEADAELSRACR
jgi:hypothetical protein